MSSWYVLPFLRFLVLIGVACWGAYHGTGFSCTLASFAFLGAMLRGLRA